MVAVWLPPPRKESGIDRFRAVSFVIAPRNQVVLLRRATATYWPMDPARVLLWSQVVRTASNHGRPGQSAGTAYFEGNQEVSARTLAGASVCTSSALSTSSAW